jgi:hypothetical protein
MQPTSVVEPFEVLEDGTPRYLSIGETPSMHESSVFKVAMKLSYIRRCPGQFPVLPIEGTMPTSARRLPNEIAVYWTPRSE